MGLKLTHTPTTTTIELSKEPDLPLNLARSFDQDIVRTDSGLRKVFTRRVKIKRFRLSLKLLNHNDRRLLEQFYDETVNGQAELFSIELQIDRQAPLQVGATQDGSAVIVGTVLGPDCDAKTGAIEVGDWVRQDRYLFNNCRFEDSELTFADEMPKNFSTQLTIIQEIP